MSKAGGIIGIIAGVFGFIAAVVTLFIGGAGSAFNAEGAKDVIGLGGGGVLFSFLVIVFSAISISTVMWSSIAMIVCSVLGIFLGGTLVAVCMALSLIGGILAVIGAKKAPQTGIPEQSSDNATSVQKAAGKKSYWILGGVGLLVILIIGGVMSGKDGVKSKISEQMELINAQPSHLQIEGELSEIFAMGSKYTDLQREKKSKEITGQVVQWRLPVYEVSKSDDVYKIQTQSKINIMGFGQDLVGVFVYITPRNDQERQFIEALKTDDMITFKGIISGTSMRNLTVKPAILILENRQAQSQTPRQALVAAPDINTPTQTIDSPKSTEDEMQNLKQSFVAADQEITDVYHALMSSLSAGVKAELKREQIAWIKQKESTCNSLDDEAQRLKCLTSMTKERTAALKEYTINAGD